MYHDDIIVTGKKRAILREYIVKNRKYCKKN